MAIKPTSVRQLEERFVCQYRTHNDHEPAVEQRPRERPQRSPERRRWRLFLRRR